MLSATTVIIKNDLEAIEPLVEYLKAISNTVGLNQKETQRISYALEETLQNSILFDFEQQSEEDINITISPIASGLKIIISDHGIPKNPFKKIEKSLDEIAEDISFESLSQNDGDTINAISDFVVHKLLDRYRYSNQGKKGRSIEMVIYASQHKIDESVTASYKEEEGEIFTSIKTPQSLEIVGISRLFYKSYGYSYVNDIVYYPERLQKALDERHLHSQVAISDKARVIGHVALMRPYEGASITEWGMAISDPGLRGQGVMSKLIDVIMEEAKSLDFCGVFAHSVTNHEFTQKICSKYGFSNVALLVGYTGSDLSFKKINNDLAQRESTIIDYLSLSQESSTKIFMPPAHKDMIQKLYKGIGVDIEEKSSSSIEYATTTQIVDTVVSALNIAEIVLQKTGDDALKTLQYITKKFELAKIDVIYLIIDLEDGVAVSLVSDLERFGYIFAGIFPNYHHKHSLILQFINNLSFDYSLIKSYTPLACELKEYIRKRDPNQIDMERE